MQGELAGIAAHRLAASDFETQWHRNGATRFAVIDGFLPPERAAQIHDAFVKGREFFSRRDSLRERKSTSTRFDDLPAILRNITFALQSGPVVSVVAERLGIDGLAGDPTLYAGGVSMMGQGDFLNPHIDNSHEATRTRYRRVNLLYYVTPDWRMENGGNLELWDERVTRPVTIHSRFNRLVLMETHRSSWHSVSPVKASRQRCCVSNYYFSPQSPSEADYYHVTSFTGRPEQRARRVLAPLDNAARMFARQALGMRRASDRGYHGSTALYDHVPGEPAVRQTQ